MTLRSHLSALLFGAAALASPALAQDDLPPPTPGVEAPLAYITEVQNYIRGTVCGPYFMLAVLHKLDGTPVETLVFHVANANYAAMMPAQSLELKVDDSKRVPTATPEQPDEKHADNYYLLRLSSKDLETAGPCLPHTPS